MDNYRGRHTPSGRGRRFLRSVSRGTLNMLLVIGLLLLSIVLWGIVAVGLIWIAMKLIP
jgi:hypothetical protein